MATEKSPVLAPLVALSAQQARTIRALTDMVNALNDVIVEQRDENARLRRELREADGLIEWEAQREMAS